MIPIIVQVGKVWIALQHVTFVEISDNPQKLESLEIELLTGTKIKLIGSSAVEFLGFWQRYMCK